MNLLTRFVSLLILGLLSFSAFSQSFRKEIEASLEENRENLNLTKDDIQEWIITNQHDYRDLTYVYIQQKYAGVPVYNAVANFVIKDGNITMIGNSFIANISGKIQNSDGLISAKDAIQMASESLGQGRFESLKLSEKEGDFDYIFSAQESLEEIPVKQMYFLLDEKVLKVWDLSIYAKAKDHWWSVRLDAESGELLDQVDWIVSCNYEGSHQEHVHATESSSSASVEVSKSTLLMPPPPPPNTDQYRVFAIPTESPSHGGRSLVVGPADPIASPFGWHDDNGVAGNEYTITRGNNVHASDDIDDNDNPGFSPDGTSGINFDFPLNINQEPLGYLDVSVTNLFYMNNIMHDVWYQYGFDEASGNFQQNNYGHGGNASDYVYADAQDGGGTNNANFGTPPDGSNPRMQMFLWGAGSGFGTPLTINSPSVLAGDYEAVPGTIGASLPVIPVTADIAIFDDGVGPENYDACEDLAVPGSMNGKIAIMIRGNCQFGEKIMRAQNSGAVAVLVVNNSGGPTISMGGTDPGITIPAVMITQALGASIISEIEAGGTVNGSLGENGPYEVDGDFDNGIIAHEYGHGISTRLTGGGDNSNCLFNEEQMGEGWSDWFGLMLTIEPGDQAEDVRGIGTFATNEPTTGNGIRPAPYSTDFAINDFTYDATNDVGSISQPHGIGFVWCSMLWDLTWALIDQYGYDSDVYTGTGGNNIAMNLVINGLKLQACSPGFVDGRDAILLADEMLYNGANECLIWEVFANRGLGYSADQGDPDDRTDQLEAFDLPPAGNSSVEDVVACNTYLWPVNGLTYTTSGTYTVGVTCDSSATLNLTVNLADPSFTVSNGVLTANSTTATSYQWIHCNAGNAPVAGATNSTFVPAQSGNYSLQVTQGECTATSFCQFTESHLSLEELENTLLSIHPNPVKEFIVIDGLNNFVDITSVQILTAGGRVVSVLDSSSKEVNVSDLSKGVYLLMVNHNDGVEILKFIKE
ncbi:MAG: T9SS-dependent M36 family metallopeptidase [Crocinitomicaceae bacterium]|nr:T9SS-dependent M36 family metallopeptidase [Crocinitomicaceae bacterium]